MRFSFFHSFDEVVVFEDYLQAFSLEVFLYLFFIPFRCGKDEVAAPSPQGLQHTLKVGETLLHRFLSDAAGDDAFMALHEHPELVQTLACGHGTTDFRNGFDIFL